MLKTILLTIYTSLLLNHGLSWLNFSILEKIYSEHILLILYLLILFPSWIYLIFLVFQNQSLISETKKKERISAFIPKIMKNIFIFTLANSLSNFVIYYKLVMPTNIQIFRFASSQLLLIYILISIGIVTILKIKKQ